MSRSKSLGPNFDLSPIKFADLLSLSVQIIPIDLRIQYTTIKKFHYIWETYVLVYWKIL